LWNSQERHVTTRPASTWYGPISAERPGGRGRWASVPSTLQATKNFTVSYRETDFAYRAAAWDLIKRSELRQLIKDVTNQYLGLERGWPNPKNRYDFKRSTGQSGPERRQNAAELTMGLQGSENGAGPGCPPRWDRSPARAELLTGRGVWKPHDRGSAPAPRNIVQSSAAVTCGVGWPPPPSPKSGWVPGVIPLTVGGI